MVSTFRVCVCVVCDKLVCVDVCERDLNFANWSSQLHCHCLTGYTVNSIGDCVPLAHPRWKTESEEVKKKYEAKAKAHKQVNL